MPCVRHGLAWVGLALVVGLTACAGGDDPVLPVVPGPDRLTLALGQAATVLSNDTIDGLPVSVGTAGTVRFAVTSGALPAGITAVDGQVRIAANATPGSFSFTYSLCEVLNPDNCGSTTAQITVPNLSIVAVADSVSLVAGAGADVLANDTLGGAPATAATVVVSAASLPTGVQVSVAGLVTVDASAAPGSYPIAYTICQTSVLSNCASSTLNLTVPSPAVGVISGRAVSATSGVGIAGVVVQAGGQTATADAGGNFSLANVPSGQRIAVQFAAASYAPTVRLTTLPASGQATVQARLLPVGATVAVDAAVGGTVNVPGSSAQVVISPNSLQRADGTAPTGAVTVILTPIDPSTDASVMPGDFTTVVDDAEALIESFGAVNVRVRDAGGAALDLKPGQVAALRIPLGTRSPAPPTTVPLFRFDDATGRWIQDGTTARTGTGTAAFFSANVSRLGTWNADQVITTVRVNGCVVDVNGVRLAGATVVADGIDYSGSSSARTDANGSFALSLRRAGQAAVVGVADNRVTNTLRLGPYDTDTTVSNCLALGSAGAGVSMKLTWGTSPDDLDAHLLTPNGQTVYFGNQGNLVNVPYANLDVDDTTRFGPEVTTLTRLMVGTYQYAVNNYSTQAAGSIGASGARVELSLPGRAVELFVPPTTGESSSTNWWLLFRLDVAADCTITVQRQGSFSTAAPTPAATSAPVYCQPG